MNDSFNLEGAVKESIVSKLVEIAIDKFANYIGKRKEPIKHDLTIDFEEKILNHFNELYNWSKEIEFVGLGKPVHTKKTIELTYYFSRIKLNIEEGNNRFTENDIIHSTENVVIEGDPGSGKSTTLKRILSNYFFTDDNRKSLFLYPLLIRFRAVENSYNLFTYICELLGLNYQSETKQYEVMVEKEIVKIIDEKQVKTKEKKKEIREKLFYSVNGIPIAKFIAELLNANNVLLVMDGLDEVRPELLEEFQKEIREFSVNLSSAKFIITTRGNYLKSILLNTVIYQVKELTEEQIKAIADLWLGNSNKFLEELRKKSYYELANRPLFLSFLILLYKESGQIQESCLPKYSREVYKQIIELLVIKWDKERDIHRHSKYAYFDKQRKLEFLSHLSFNLTYIIKQKVFSHEDLKIAYLKIYDQFELPLHEADQVAEEIENHTGIIIKSFYDKFEFSHLAIQEFLCANYIVNAPFGENIRLYLKEYPSPLALSISLSTDPSLWFYELTVKINLSISDVEERTQITTQILNRLLVETPYLSTNVRCGIAIMNIARFCNCNDKNFLFTFNKFLNSNNNVKQSIKEVLKSYSTVPKKNIIANKLIYERKPELIRESFPETLCLPIKSDK